MNAKRRFSWGRFFLAIGAYLVPTFPLGYVWHLVLFQSQYHQLQMYREEVIIPLGLASMAVQAVLFAWIYPRVFNTRRDRWISSAFQFFIVFGLLAWSFTTLPVAAKYRMASVADFLLLESSFTAVHFLLIAPLLALAHRESKNRSGTPRGIEETPAVALDE